MAVASWLIEHGEKEFGSSWLSIGGEHRRWSACAIRGRVEAFRAANLLFGCFDLSLTPSMRLAKNTPFVTLERMKQLTSAFAGDHDLRDPAISPLHADLRGLPPALFTVGSIDPLVDDSLFMHSRWQAAGDASQIAIYAGGTHGFNSFDGELAARANLGMAQVLAAVHPP